MELYYFQILNNNNNKLTKPWFGIFLNTDYF